MDSQVNYLHGVVPNGSFADRNNIIKVQTKYTAEAYSESSQTSEMEFF